MTARPKTAIDPFGIGRALEQAKHPSKPWYKNKKLWTVAAILVVVIGVRIALNPVATAYSRKGLNTALTGYHGSLKGASVNIFPFSYTVDELKLQEDGKDENEPVIYLKKAEARLLWGRLLSGQIVATLGIDQAKVVIQGGANKAPPEAKEAAKKVAKEVKKNDFDIGAVLQKVIPLRADRIEARDSEALLVDATDPKAPQLWVSDVQLTVENLVTRKNLDENAPLEVTLRAKVAKTGQLKLLATADLLADKPAFSGEAQLSGLKLESMDAWIKAKAGLYAKGSLDAFVNFNSAKAVLSGDVKVMIKNAEITPATGKMSDSINAHLGNLAIKVLSDRVEGRNAIATTLPIRGMLTDPDPQLWPTILGVVRNAFVQGLSWGFEDLPKATTEQNGALKQTAEALNKGNAGAPKAEARGGK